MVAIQSMIVQDAQVLATAQNVTCPPGTFSSTQSKGPAIASKVGPSAVICPPGSFTVSNATVAQTVLPTFASSLQIGPPGTFKGRELLSKQGPPGRFNAAAKGIPSSVITENPPISSSTVGPGPPGTFSVTKVSPLRSGPPGMFRDAGFSASAISTIGGAICPPGNFVLPRGSVKVVEAKFEPSTMFQLSANATPFVLDNMHVQMDKAITSCDEMLLPGVNKRRTSSVDLSSGRVVLTSQLLSVVSPEALKMRSPISSTVSTNINTQGVESFGRSRASSSFSTSSVFSPSPRRVSLISCASPKPIPRDLLLQGRVISKKIQMGPPGLSPYAPTPTSAARGFGFALPEPGFFRTRPSASA